MEPSITTNEPNTTTSVSQGTIPQQQIDTGSVGTPQLGKKRNSSKMSATSPPSSSSKLQNDEDIGSKKMDAILSAGLHEKQSSKDTSPKSSEEKHNDNYSVSTGNNSHDSVHKGGSVNDHSRPNLAAASVLSSASSSTSHSTLEPLVHITASLDGVPNGRMNTTPLRGAQKDYYSPTNGGRLPMARGSSVRRISGASLNQSEKDRLNRSGKHVEMLGMSGKSVSIKGSFNSAYHGGESTIMTTPHNNTTREKTTTQHGGTGGGAGGGSREHRRYGILRYDRFWDGVHAMIDIQNSTKLQHEITTKNDTKKHLSDFDRLR